MFISEQVHQEREPVDDSTGGGRDLASSQSINRYTRSTSEIAEPAGDLLDGVLERYLIEGGR